ncbi:MAG: TetR/AcrR family transcriptional regulator [Candidatus Enteromonas sp.]|nr:TetR/AcrR family transcriptional regulator [Candidatus Enteromonas sp.]
MKDKILSLTIQNLKADGLRFSVDELAKELRISKKTIYKYFPSKEALAKEVFSTYFREVTKEILDYAKNNPKDHYGFLLRYADTFWTLEESLFNKFQLQESIRELAFSLHQELERTLSPYFMENESLRFILNSTLFGMEKAKLKQEDRVDVLQNLTKLWTL